MNVQFGSRMMAVCVIALALAACSRGWSAQSLHQGAASAPAAAATPAPPAEASAPAEPMVRGLPDFSQLVDRYGAAVVNVTVVEKAQAVSPNDPLNDLFRRFGI